jgi:hypothetical protein
MSKQTRARLREQLVPGSVVRFRGRPAVVLHRLVGKHSKARVQYRDGQEATVTRVQDVVLGPGGTAGAGRAERGKEWGLRSCLARCRLRGSTLRKTTGTTGRHKAACLRWRLPGGGGADSGRSDRGAASSARLARWAHGRSDAVLHGRAATGLARLPSFGKSELVALGHVAVLVAVWLGRMATGTLPW